MRRACRGAGFLGVMMGVAACAVAPPAPMLPSSQAAAPPLAGRTTVRLPHPTELPEVFEIEVPRDREAMVVLKRVCPFEETVVDGPAWVAALQRAHYVAQASRFWGDVGPVVVRFRKGDLVGDLYSSREFDGGCRHYTVRAQHLAGRRADVTWNSVLGGRAPVFYCVRHFPVDARFPFRSGTYSWNCPGDANP